MKEWWRRLTASVRRDVIDAELEEEMRTHLEMKAAMTGDFHAARRSFGNATLLLEDSRAAWGWARPEAWLRDFHYAVRVVVRKPGFATTVVLALALGIGASSTIFALIDTVLIRPLPYPHSDRLVAINEAKFADQDSYTPVAPGRMEDWQRLNRSFAAIAGSHRDNLTDTTGALPERLSGAYVSPRFFATLGTLPVLGRVFTPEEERFGGPLAIILSDGLWTRRFSADPGVLGRNLILDGRSYSIVGVMPPSFQYPDAAIEIWVSRQASADLMQIREARFYDCIGRLSQGITLEQGLADLAAVQRRLGEHYPKTDAGWTVAMEPLKERLVGRVRLALWLLLGSVSMLLLITCANVACLLIARLSSRTTELATRCSLGAGRPAIARQLFAEGLVYALSGGLLGMIASFAGIEFLRNRVSNVPRIAELAVDVRMLGLVAGISVMAAIVFSFAPILQTFRRDLTGVLIKGGRTLTGPGQRMSRVLVSAQLAIATALLIGAGLFVQTLIRLEAVPLGFRPENVLTLRVSAGLEPPDAATERHRRVMDALSSVPGVNAVSMSSGLPGVNPTWPREFDIAGEATPDRTLRFASWRIVTAQYFQTVGIPILEGRSCRMNTDLRSPFETLVNRSFTARYFQGRNPIGHTILGGPQGDSAARIVGVVADAREDGHSTAPRPLIYACGFLRYWPDSDFLVQARNPMGLAAAVREVIREIEPSRPVYSVRTLSDALHGALSQTRFRTMLISLFSMMALMLAAIGLYGVMAYMVSQRTREIGIRLALGARPSQIVAEIVRSGGALAAIGATAGVVIAAAASRLLGSLLYGVRASDMTTYLSAIGLLFAVALLACAVPSRRATSIDPTEALREQ